MMSKQTFEAAYGTAWQEPGLGSLNRRFHWAFLNTGGDIASAMATVNEMLEAPLSYEEFLALFTGPAA